ncbi:PucR family transcriptional regulator [Brevibacterium renqingii]|uniref:PucR family transcriptional regulator n=1 Tax=Brevibacterium renqingii TaxID=2776916 RepID=UPI001AE0C9FF|nr:helix-turn-helix domain-containing protein [Brevibacterium renqingii]
MTDTAGVRLSRLLRDAESLLLPLTEAARDHEVTRIDFGFDLSQAPAARTRGAVVLITEAVHSRSGLDTILAEHAEAAALVLPPGAHAHLGDAETSGHTEDAPVLLERSPHVTWSETLVHLRQLTEGVTSALAWPDVDDLSALAAVIAESTGASITIEDPGSRVLAHANLGGELDEIRRETILSGAIPAWRIAELEESGFLDTIRRSTDVVERPAAGSSPARSVIALRSEGELIGTIWAAYPAAVDPGPLRDVLRDAARAALPVMLRTLRRSPFEKRIRREALSGILAGSVDLGPAATLLALPFSGHYCALAFAEVAPEREPVLRFHLRAAFADAVLAHVDPGADLGPIAGKGAHLAALVQMSEPLDAERIRDHVLATLRRSLPAGERLCFGVGGAVDRLDEVHRSWTEAVYVVDALPRRPEPADSGPASDESLTGATAADVAAEVVGLRVADALLSAGGRDGDERVVRPARVLARHDANHNGSLLETLRVYFATVGNSAEASRRLHVHTNSLRHRLGRIEEITGLSTAAPADRLWLELSVLAHDRASG